MESALLPAALAIVLDGNEEVLDALPNRLVGRILKKKLRILQRGRKPREKTAHLNIFEKEKFKLRLSARAYKLCSYLVSSAGSRCAMRSEARNDRRPQFKVRCNL